MPPTPGNADLSKFIDPAKVRRAWLKRAGTVLAILLVLALIANGIGII
jgi:hypothetical protein